MKVTVGYTIFNQAQEIPQIVEGLRQSLAGQENVDFIFTFDVCRDGSHERFLQHEHQLPGPVRHQAANHEPWFETRSNNYLLEKAFTGENPSDVLVILQSDMVLEDTNLVPMLEALIRAEGLDRIGLIGGRDGYRLMRERMMGDDRDLKFNHLITDGVCAVWSPSKRDLFPKELPYGSWQAVEFVNRLIIFTRNVYEAVGPLDTMYEPLLFDESDFCRRAIAIGRQNFLMPVRIREVRRTSEIPPATFDQIWNRNGRQFFGRWYR